MASNDFNTPQTQNNNNFANTSGANNMFGLPAQASPQTSGNDYAMTNSGGVSMPAPSRPILTTQPVGQPPAASSDPGSLSASMLPRMQAVQNGQPDPGNPDLYGYNQALAATDPFAASGGGQFINGGWIPNNNPAAIAAARAAAGQAATPTAPAAPTTPSTPAAPTDDTLVTTANGLQIPGYQPSTQGGDMIKKLMDIANTSTNVDPNDPTIKNNVDAYAATQERQRRNAINDAAESNGPYASGANDLNARMMTETAAQNTAGYQGQLMTQELQNRRDTIQNALNTMSSSLSQEDQDKLQAELGNLNSALSQKQMGIQQGEFGQSLAQQSALAQMQADLQRQQLSQQNTQFGQDLSYRLATLLQGGSQFGQSLGQNESQFLDNLGLNVSNQQSFWDNLQRNNGQ